MIYDGSDHGTLKNIAAFDVRTFNDGSWLLVFSANQVIPGLGTATPRDIVRFMPDDHDIFPLGPGAYSWYMRGANRPDGGGGDIDALTPTRHRPRSVPSAPRRGGRRPRQQ
ncbi:MAG: hypothetical protein IPH95_16115 [Candidatus Promineofilum sp.]|nr:hypothetical protein [Promineifilum sp.]